MRLFTDKEESMFGMRCNECGEVRWSIRITEGGSEMTCPACGAEMVEERRYPGRVARRRRFQDERREAPYPESAGGAPLTTV